MSSCLGTRIALGLLVAVAAIAVVAAATWTVGNDTPPAHATHGILSMGLDVDTTGNTATSVDASPETCRTVTSGTQFTVDIYETEVVDLVSWETYLRFNENVLRVDGRSIMFQTVQPNSNVVDTSESTPDTSGLYRAGAADQSVQVPGDGDDGDGVLARITFFALQNGSGDISIAPIDLNQDGVIHSSGDIGPWMKRDTGVLINDANGNGFFDGPIGTAGINVGPGIDTDGDTVLDACDADDDADGICDFGGPLPSGTPGAPSGCAAGPGGADNCPVNANASQTNTDFDSMGDACDPDDDNDTVLDGSDNCPLVANPSQANADGDALGDACDNDDDNDTVPDATDNCPSIANANQLNTDGKPDGGNACDTDDDNDGFDDTLEAHIGTDSLDLCANDNGFNNEADDRWGADFDDSQVFNIGDINSFLFPLRADQSFNKFNHPVPDPQDPLIARWDIQQSTSINIGDLNAINPALNIPTARPPMFNGQPAFARNCTILPP